MTPLSAHIQNRPCKIVGKLNSNVYKWYFLHQLIFNFKLEQFIIGKQAIQHHRKIPFIHIRLPLLAHFQFEN